MSVKTFRRRSYVALVGRASISSFFNGLSQQYVNLYVFELGISVAELGFLRSLASLFSSITNSILGFLSDMLDRRKVYLAALALEALAPLSLFLARDWNTALVGLTLLLVGAFAVMNVENILVADLMPSKSRALGYGIVGSVATLVSLVSPLVAAVIVEAGGGISAESIRPLFLIQFAGLAAGALLVAPLVKDYVSPSLREGLRSAIRDSIGMVRENSSLRRWLIVEILGGYVWRSSIPFNTIYLVEVKGATAMTLGLMGFASNLAYLLSSPLVGRLADKVGRVRTIIALRSLLYISMAMMLLAPSHEYLIAAWALRGVWFSSSSAFRALTMELVPEEARGRWTGVRELARSLASVPAPAIGGLLYSLAFPEAPFIVAMVLDAAVRLPLIYLTPETLALAARRYERC